MANLTGRQFLYDGMNVVQELMGGSPSANLISGGIDEFFSRIDASGSYSPLTDALGSVLAITDAVGTVQTQYTYGPFGNTLQTGTANSNTFQYTGRENDGNGLYYYRARYYDSVTGRFISEDPIRFQGGSNFYRYAINSPIQFSDPSGKDAPLPSGFEPPPQPPVPAKGCVFWTEFPSSGPCKTCAYICRGYGGIVTYSQAVGKPCPGIRPDGLVDIDKLDPNCNKPNKDCLRDKIRDWVRDRWYELDHYMSTPRIWWIWYQVPVLTRS